jgi:hypothetical protein
MAAAAKPKGGSAHAWALLIAGGGFAILTLVRFRALTSDSFMTLVGGREVSRHGLPALDHLTVAGAGRHWIDQQWLAQWVLYRAWVAGGYPLLALLASVLVASAFGVLALILFERGAHPRRVIKWTLLAFATALPDMAIRAQDFAYPLFALLVWLLLRDLDAPPSSRRMAAAAALLLVWANLHGSVLVGSLLVAAYCAWRTLTWALRSRRTAALFLLTGLVAVASPLATPYGARTARYYDNVLGNAAIRRFSSEWKPATPTTIAAIAFFALVAALVFALVLGWRRKVHPSKPLLAAAAVSVIAGFVELRWQTWAAFPATVIAVDTLNASDPDPKPIARPRRRWVDVTVGLAAALGVLVLFAQRESRFERTAPLGAIAAVSRYADAHPGTRILGDDHSSDALLWKRPELSGRVGLDDRLEVFAPKTVNQWFDYIVGRSGASHGLTAGYDLLVASRANAALTKRLLSMSGWRVLYKGHDGVALARD